MYKRWLSQALEHAAFPLVVLAVALSQVKTNHHTELSLLQHKGIEPERLAAAQV
jgi:hypothetical protein